MAGRGLVAALLASVALAACGGEEHKPGLTAPQRQGLSTRVALVRESAAAGDLETTRRRLRGFRREVLRLRRAGALDAATARALVVGAIRADARAGSEIVPPPPAATPSQPAQTPAPAPAKKEKHDKKPKDHGKGKKHGDKKHGEEGDG
jgi:hypothetical protein